MKLTLLKFSILTFCLTTHGHSSDSDSFNNEIGAPKAASPLLEDAEVEAFLASLRRKTYLIPYFNNDKGDQDIDNPFSKDSDTSSVCVSGAGVFGTGYVGEDFDPELLLSQFEPEQVPAAILPAAAVSEPKSAAVSKPKSKENTQPSRKKGRDEPVETRSRSRLKVDPAGL